MARIIAGLIVILLTLFSLVASPLVGALVGWVTGLLFDSTFAAVLAAFHIQPVEPWQLGAFFGFVGGFFRSSSTQATKS